jgi:carbonic anhydrase
LTFRTTDIAAPVSVTDEYLRNNEAYARNFHGPLPLPPAKHIAVVACINEVV